MKKGLIFLISTMLLQLTAFTQDLDTNLSKVEIIKTFEQNKVLRENVDSLNLRVIYADSLIEAYEKKIILLEYNQEKYKTKLENSLKINIRDRQISELKYTLLNEKSFRRLSLGLSVGKGIVNNTNTNTNTKSLQYLTYVGVGLNFRIW